jgi:hypothetical protein
VSAVICGSLLFVVGDDAVESLELVLFAGAEQRRRVSVVDRGAQSAAWRRNWLVSRSVRAMST